ncbi:MAG: methyltransferase domain-containing protein [Archangium sp.]|nr:methyltransferase domain-containing protein [Archangium sp.]
MASKSVRWRAESRPCPLCAETDSSVLGMRGGSAHRRQVGIETNVVRCKRCNLLYTRPTLVPDGNPYEEESVDSYFAHLHDDITLARGYHYAETAQKLLGAPGRMLEVGCGLGLYLQGARERGWKVRGVDFTSAFVESAAKRGIEVECAGPLDSKFLDEQYDCILLVNILEHLYEPREVLARVFKALRPGGVVAIGVPNELGLTARAGNLYFKTQGKPWAMNLSPTFPPFHVIGFSPQSLRFGLEQAGLEVVALETVLGYNDMEKATTLRGRVESAALSAILRTAQVIGQGDALDCWARRPLAS